jgi:DMSO reductase family type II enzyme heme b subunit
MPSFFAEKTENGKLSEDDRWHVTNYVMSLADANRQIKEGAIVVKGVLADQLPKDVNDELWSGVSGTTFLLVPQIIEKDRFFMPSNDLVSVKALFTDKNIAFLIEYDDRTKSVPGDKEAEGIAWDGLSPDGLAIQTPVTIPESSEKPYFGHGDASHSVSMLYWNSGSVEKPNTVKMFTATGSGTRKESDMGAAGYKVSSAYHEGTWKIMMTRSLLTPNKESDTQFETGRYIPIAFANWDGSNGERGSKHTMTTWRWLLLQPETGSKVVTYPGGVFLVLVIGQLLFSGYLRKNKV